MENKEELNDFEKKDKAKVASSNAKCANCGSNIVFDPKSGKLKCPQCSSEFDFPKKQGQIKHYIKNTVENVAEHEKWAEGMRLVKCQTCGAEIMLDGLATTSVCPYCGSDYVVEKSSLGGLKPDVILPFAFDEDEAGERFVNGVKKKFFVPRQLKKKLPIDKIRGIYVPTFTFDNDTFTRYEGVLSKTETHTDSKGRSYTTTKRFSIKGTKTLNFRDYVIESSSQMNTKQMNALLPFNMQQSYEYTDDFIRGYSVEHYEDALNVCYTQARRGMEEQIKASILSQYDYSSVDSFNMHVTYSNELYSYRLMPIYCFEFQYKKKKYIAQMNGQTGKIGKGLPISPLKVGILVSIGVIAIVLIIILIMYMSNS
jgi:DNA-directed RNA polymerase subunit RPC12/RpoP